MIYDITQPLLESAVFPGHPKPESALVESIERGDGCNLTKVAFCVHNGTHVDAPRHFYRDGRSIDQVSLEKFIGPAYVEKHDGYVTEQDARGMLQRAEAARAGASRRLLIAGDATVTLEAAKVFAEAGVYLVGNDSQTVGPSDSPAAVHYELLGAEVVLLEGVRLGAVPDGAYLLNCAPLRLTGSDGSPCRAVLMDLGKY